MAAATLWTLQSLEAHERLARDGALRGTWDHVPPDFEPAYRWMVGAMRRRGVDTAGQPPIWAWVAWEPPARPRPDLRASGHAAPGTPLVRIEFEADPAAYVASLFEAWHAVLNRWVHTWNEAESDALGEPSLAVIEASWDRIFDLAAGDPTWCGPIATRAVQATLVELDLEAVRRVTPFVAR